MTAPRVVVVGAGPAGIRAALTLLRAGLRPVIIDEASRAGGQIYRRPPPAAGFVRPPGTLYGFEAGKAMRLHAAFDAALPRLDYRPRTLVWDIVDGAVHTAGEDGGTDLVAYDALILAPGAMDRVIPLPGWTLPGVFTLGGAQVALKYQGCAVGERTLFVGTGPLLYLAAHQYLRAEAGVVGVLDTAPAAALARVIPGLLADPLTLAKGLHLVLSLRLRGIRVENGVHPLRVVGDGAVGGLQYRGTDGQEREIACDAVAIGYGLKPETQLMDLAGCRFRYDSVVRHWLPEADPDGRATGVPGLYLAGDGAGIAGADAAELSGERAAWSLLRDHGLADSPSRRRQHIARRLARLGRFRQALEQTFPFPAHLAESLPDDTILCRCEMVPVGTLRAAVRALGGDDLNRLKASSRVGMGRCQGRVCGPAAAEIAAASGKRPIEAVSRLRGQPPVKPLPTRYFVGPTE
jgi:NADPH-dependent 2,4-dienoyl-CoA reductase/sulfur reductase-like enzyme